MGPVLAERPKALPPITDPTMGGQVVAGVEADRAYNALAIRYVNLLDWVECVREAIATDDLKICEKKNK